MLIKTFFLSGMALLGSGIATADSLTTNKDKASYTIGYNLGYSYRTVDSLIDVQHVIEGLTAGLRSSESQLSVVEMQNAMKQLQLDINIKLAENARLLAETNKGKSADYMKKVSKERGVKRIEKGLYYKMESHGKGVKPKLSDWVTLQYQGALSDGTVFYDTFKFNTDETFLLSQTIPGWQKAIQNMTEGSTWVIYISPELAYGALGPASIGPNQALTYKIKLISVKPPV